MQVLLVVIHVLICISLIIVILLQAGRGGGLAGAFGGGGMGAVFGGRGAATFLNKLTSGLAIAFMLSCLAQGFLQPQRGRVKSVVQEAARRKATSQATALPTTTPSQTEAVDEFELPPAPAESGKGE